MKVLLAIKPEFADKIFSGVKRYEYRKVIFTKNVDKVLVYASSPVSKVVGEFTIDSIAKDKPDKAWQETKDYAGITKSYFKDYFKGKDIAYAIKIKDYCKYSKPLTLKEIGVEYAPQSFVYLRKNLKHEKEK